MVRIDRMNSLSVSGWSASWMNPANLLRYTKFASSQIQNRRRSPPKLRLLLHEIRCCTSTRARGIFFTHRGSSKEPRCVNRNIAVKMTQVTQREFKVPLPVKAKRGHDLRSKTKLRERVRKIRKICFWNLIGSTKSCVVFLSSGIRICACTLVEVRIETNICSTHWAVLRRVGVTEQCRKRPVGIGYEN